MSAPRWIVRLLEAVVPDEAQDDVVGDLEELHRRRVARHGTGPARVITSLEGIGLVVAHGFGAIRRGPRGGNRWVSGSEVRLAWRLVRREPVMTLTAVAALGVGIGITAGGVSVARQAIYGSLPFDDADRWVVIETYDEASGRRVPLDLARLRAFREGVSALDYVAAAVSEEYNVVLDDGAVERIPGAAVSPATFAHLPYVPVLGRLFAPDDGRVGSEPVALIRESLWRRRFGATADVTARTIDVAGVDHRILGVLPDGAEYPSEGEIWLPIDEETFGATTDLDAVAGSRQIAILAAGATFPQLEEQLARTSATVAESGAGATTMRHRVTPMARTMAGPQAQVGVAVMVSLLLAVLLVIAANVANLIATRTARREGELAVRTALGASRGRIIGQLFVEVLAIGALAAVPALAIAAGILSLYDGILDELPFWVHLGLDPITGITVAVLAVLASGVIGAAPAWRATRRDTADALRATGRGGALGVGRVGAVMIATEVALSVALLSGAALFARGYAAYLDPAFDLPDDRVLTARLAMSVSEADLVEGGAPTVRDSMMSVVEAMEATLAELPGVRGVGVASHLPRMSPYPEPIMLEGTSGIVATPIVWQGPGLFDALDVIALQGRGIRRDDLAADAPRVAVVNASFAMTHYGTLQVLGRRLRLQPQGDDAPPPWREIVGVVPDVMEVTGSGAAAGIYLPFEPVRFFSVALRVDANPLALSGQVRQALFGLDPRLNVAEVVRLDGVGSENREAFGVMSSAMSAIGAITLLLSLAGVYAIVSLSVTRRTREIGVRVALGAARGAILWSILRRSTLIVAAGGVLGALAGSRLSGTSLFVFAVPEAGPWLYVGLVGAMVAAAFVACWVPARRALAVQPVEALRSEA